jgi:hypothetical protein
VLLEEQLPDLLADRTAEKSGRLDLMMKKWCIPILCILCLWLLSACGGAALPAESPRESGSAASLADSGDSTDGYAALEGFWVVGGIYYQSKVIDLHDVPSLEDLYDSTYLSFDEDGTFLYINHFAWGGTYSRLNSDAREPSFLLKTEAVYRMEFQGDDVNLVEIESDAKTSYVVTCVSGDENSLFFSEYDSVTGKEKAAGDPLIFVKSGQKSTFIESQKVDLSGSGSSSGSHSGAPSGQTPSGTTETHTATPGEKRALSSAESYLDYTAFSYSGLIEQLEYEGFSSSEATYAADHCGADWDQQSLRMAKDYLSYSAFSYTGLVEQLVYEGFSDAQAAYGADKCGADWYEQAVRMAREYLEYSSFSRSELIDQLEYEGFTAAQAEYGVNHAY